MIYNALTPEEKNVLIHKGTEAPGSGEYESLTRNGIYLCRRCDAPLYDAKDKFNAYCGWPSFDDEIPGSIIRLLDNDGMRTEILCATCGGHLGHVFEGEMLTPKNTRHCVNSLSMRFIPHDFSDQETPFVVFGGGCFWCLDAAFRNIKGVTEVISGYAGGSVPHPTYETVSTGGTGHAEVVRVAYDNSDISYADILRIFFMIHDPTTVNRQGSDVGTQYRSLVLYATWQQKIETGACIRQLERDAVFDAPIVTEIRSLVSFQAAEEFHQNYYAKHPKKAYCQAVIQPKLNVLRQKVAKHLVNG